MASAADYDDKARVEQHDPKPHVEHQDAYALFLQLYYHGNADAYQFFRGASRRQSWKQRFRKVSPSISHIQSTN